jgi:hypothetical protein
MTCGFPERKPKMDTVVDVDFEQAEMSSVNSKCDC